MNQILQNAVNHLDQYKRRIGNQYDRDHKFETAKLYNDIEDNIRTLCKEYNLTRKYKPYKIKHKPIGGGFIGNE